LCPLFISSNGTDLIQYMYPELNITFILFIVIKFKENKHYLYV